MTVFQTQGSGFFKNRLDFNKKPTAKYPFSSFSVLFLVKRIEITKKQGINFLWYIKPSIFYVF